MSLRFKVVLVTSLQPKLFYQAALEQLQEIWQVIANQLKVLRS